MSNASDVHDALTSRPANTDRDVLEVLAARRLSAKQIRERPAAPPASTKETVSSPGQVAEPGSIPVWARPIEHLPTRTTD
jgi:hypothetical protein